MMAMKDEQIRTRAKKKLVRVTFPDGEVICYNNATSTMIAALNKIGSDKFPAINLELCHLPLLSKEIYPQYKEWMKPVSDGWYLNAQSNSDNKYLQLRSISDQSDLISGQIKALLEEQGFLHCTLHFPTPDHRQEQMIQLLSVLRCDLHDLRLRVRAHFQQKFYIAPGFYGCQYGYIAVQCL